MPLLQVAYTVPVEVVVNTDTGAVERVVVIDEEVHPTHEQGMLADVHDREYNAIDESFEGAALANKAREIAEKREWPPWDHGW